TGGTRSPRRRRPRASDTAPDRRTGWGCDRRRRGGDHHGPSSADARPRRLRAVADDPVLRVPGAGCRAFRDSRLYGGPAGDDSAGAAQGARAGARSGWRRAMSRTARLLLFAASAAGLGVVLIYGLSGLPAFGHYHGVYGRIVNGIGVTERH